MAEPLTIPPIAARQSMYEHNQAVQAVLRERGFRT
jgi:hypothetical protein